MVILPARTHGFTPRITLLALALAASYGCTTPAYPACSRQRHCDAAAQESCVDGLCQNCRIDEDCAGTARDGADTKCVDFRCVDRDGSVNELSGQQGGPCVDGVRCDEGLLCKRGVCEYCTEDLECLGGICDLVNGRCTTPTITCLNDDTCAIDEICDQHCIFEPEFEGEPLCGLESLFFADDDEALPDDAAATLRRVRDCYLMNTDRTLILEAHADDTGTEEYNILLTYKRSATIKEILAGLGVPADRIEIRAKGSVAAEGADEAARARDRRVDFLWY